MTLIKSISGIRGTIGGAAGDTLNPLDLVKFTSAFATFIKRTSKNNSNKIVVGRDARISGDMVRQIVCGTLIGMGFDVIDIGLATTPTTELAVVKENADGGIIITASHNPKQWNALKLLNHKGEFLNKKEGEEVISIAEKEDFNYASVEEIGEYKTNDTHNKKHIDEVLALKLVDKETIKNAKLNVCVDTVNSVGGIILPELFKELGVEYTIINGDANGHFAHNPEPLESNLTELINEMKSCKYDLGIAVDPDVDRLALVDEKGCMFGEEYTLVSVADYVLQNTKGNTVSNMSSTRALHDVTTKHSANYTASAVGEVNVVEAMKETKAIIGGEGNGGVIYPECHYGRDALVGIALILTYMAKSKQKISEIKANLPLYFMAKKKIELTPNTQIDEIFNKIKEQYKNEKINTIDGIKIDFEDKWVHFRRSNTEPIIRVYTEAKSQQAADDLGNHFVEMIKQSTK